MLLVLRVALNWIVSPESFLTKSDLLVSIRRQVAPEELSAFSITEEDFAWSLLLARVPVFLGTISLVSYDSIALRVEHICELILFVFGLPLSDEALQLPSLKDVPYKEVGQIGHELLH